jgi:ABC-type bacteriocin/lantibiotic exporter with double-glycine peptidase domain
MSQEYSLVTQPDKYGCVIACISMITGIDYNHISETFISHDLNRHGYNTSCQNKILNSYGYNTTVIKYKPTKINTIAILTVVSANVSNFHHAIVYIIDKSGRRYVLDPNTGYVPSNDEVYRKTYNAIDILNMPAHKFIDCTIITKSTADKKEWTKFSKQDSKNCTFGY